MTEDVRLSVQAALLNSECSPQEALRVALLAVAEFANSETIVTITEFASMAALAFHEVQVMGPRT